MDYVYLYYILRSELFLMIRWVRNWLKIKVYIFGKLLIDINFIISIKLNWRIIKEMKMLIYGYNYKEMIKF